MDNLEKTAINSTSSLIQPEACKIADTLQSNLTFKDFNLDGSIQAALERLQFESPTPIQAQSIPIALDGQDILGTAQTGTGKTAAYVIPIVSKLLADHKATALILAPTRELAAQILTFIKALLGNKSSIRAALLIGGESMPKQFFQLRAKPQIIVGTPGRINDHLNRNSLDLSKVAMLVLDEADRMLDMGFGIQIDEILKSIPKSKQTLLFSATLPKEILTLAGKYQNTPKRIAIGTTNAPVAQIDQELVKIQSNSMYPELAKRLDSSNGSTIVFVNTKFGADKLADKLCDAGYEARSIHGDLPQRKRERVIAAFRSGRHKILVATDVAARGLDVPSVELVVNFGLPQCPEDYIHRIGRTGRAGAKGKAISFITPEENYKWRAIEQLLNPDSTQSKSHNNERKDSNRKGRNRTARRFDNRTRFNRDDNRFNRPKDKAKNFHKSREEFKSREDFNSDQIVDISGYKSHKKTKAYDGSSKNFNKSKNRSKLHKKFAGARKTSDKPFPFPGYKKSSRPTLRKKVA
jgi:superfamily II DNA/RNA helicase